MANRAAKQGHLLQIRLTGEDWDRVQKMSADAKMTYTELVRGFINSWWDQTQALEEVASVGLSTEPLIRENQIIETSIVKTPPTPANTIRIVDEHINADGTIRRDWHGNP